MDGVGGVAVGPRQSHIIDFENIQNDFANILNALVGANTMANQNRLINLTNAIISTGGGARANMINLRTTLMTSITAGTVANYYAESRALLSQLNSSPDNVRVGNSAINASIGQNIDADFNPGTVAFAGGMVSTTAIPGGVVVPAQPVLTLTPTSNNQVYRYQMVTQQAISFVINPLNNRQLSSVTGPTVGTVAPAPPHPVLVTDPAGVGMPLLYT
jgi:predicted secreted protein